MTVKEEVAEQRRNWFSTALLAINGLLVLVLTIAGLYLSAVVSPIQNDIGDIKSELKALRKVLVIEWRVTRLEERLRDMLARRNTNSKDGRSLP